jgi:DNA-binding response OmpR family regulator
MVETESPDLVILDLGLPDSNGFEVLKAIRMFSDVPIVILTVSEQESDVVRGLELGANEYITKPFRQMELLARLKSVLRLLHSPEKTEEH